MNKKMFGALVVSAVASMIANGALAEDGKKATAGSAKKAAKSKDKAEMVRCFSESCAGKFEYKGEKNSCDRKAYAMSVPKDICDPKKGLKTATD